MPWSDFWKWEPNNPKSPQLKPYFLEIDEGVKYYWCSCGKSNSQPWCDGSHRGTGFRPVPYIPPYDMTSMICGCKHSETRPFCNMTHLHVYAHKHTGRAGTKLFLISFAAGIGWSMLTHP